MRNLYLLLISLLCFPCYVHGQSLLRMPFKKAPPSRTYSKFQVSVQLERRAAASFKKAAVQQSTLNHERAFTIGEPIHHVLHPTTLDPKLIYPNNPLLTTPRQTAHYMTARNNRLFLNERRRVEKLWAQIDEQLPRFQQAAKETPQPQQPINWLAKQISPQINYLFVGEVHGYKEIRHSVQELLTALRAEQPNREIFLFTEFLPEELHYQSHQDANNVPIYLHQHLPIWEQAIEENISVIGLEPDFIVEDDCDVFFLNRKGQYRKESTWATLEGVRIRNERWNSLLKQYRKQHPDALFIVYTGSGHSLYNYPFTLSTQYPQQNTYVVTFSPDKHLKLTGGNSMFSAAQYVPTNYTGPLEKLLPNIGFPQPILQLKDHSLTQLAGFDVRIKVQVTLDTLKQ
ncbi:MAG: hypothetical protein IJ266_01100 [Elusimicrobiaceae bacterium]|nr:hypothetical protein [Elusimicrobiaceae bacterium]